MNSSGKVVVDKLTSMGTEKEFYGTPSIEVNSGYLEIKKLNLNTDTIQPEYSEVMDPSPDCESTDHDAGSYQEITWVDYYGNNKLGNVTVNGGTMKIGDGMGSVTDPGSKDFVTEGTVNVAPGGSLLSGDAQSGKIKLEITGLPADAHIFSIINSAGDGMLGNYANLDAWTNSNGSFVTYVTNADNGKAFIFADDDGNAYSYVIRVSGSRATAVKQTLPEMPENFTDGTVYMYPPLYRMEGYRLQSSVHDAESGTARSRHCSDGRRRTRTGYGKHPCFQFQYYRRRQPDPDRGRH